MRTIILLLLTFLTAVCFSQTTPRHLFLITENDRMGYIDSTGEVVIKPHFRMADDFSEGLAAVRLNGVYGYIDETGDFVIPDKFDYATRFQEGIAVVYNDRLAYFIDHKGRQIEVGAYVDVQPFKEGRAIVRTATDKFGVLDKAGKLIIDTAFTWIGPFVDGRSVVHGINEHRVAGGERMPEEGVIDTLGNFVIPFGKCELISENSEGYFTALLYPEPWDTIEGNTAKTAIFDKAGNVVVSQSVSHYSIIAGCVHGGFAKMSLYQNWAPQKKNAFKPENVYGGYMNLKGEIAINDTNYVDVMDFSDNRAFVRDRKGNLFIINTRGKLITQNSYENVLGNGFKNGFAFVEFGGSWGLIDTNAHFLFQPQFSKIGAPGLIDDYFFYTFNSSNSIDFSVGIAKKDGSILFRPFMQAFDTLGFVHGLLKCVFKNKMAYVSREGKVVWQEPDVNPEQLADLNIDYMNQSYYYALPELNERERNIGISKTANFPQKIPKTIHFQEDVLSVVVDTALSRTYQDRYNAIGAHVVNNTNRKIDFNTLNNRLYMKVQAIDTKGEWRDIEYLPDNKSEFSYYPVTLPSKNFWRLVIPRYEGGFKTRMRIALSYIDPTDKSKKTKKEITIYSNEYTGSINPGQFWRKPDALIDTNQED